MGLRKVAEHVDNNLARGARQYIQKLIRYIRENRLLKKDSKIIVALSGGPDSVFLLYLLHLLRKSWNLTLIAAHFNHNLRGKESADDEIFSKNLCEKLEIEFYSSNGDVQGYSRKNKISIQESARKLRYKFLSDILKKTQSHLIATAHTADDQGEEILLRLIRGAGLSGLSGIKNKQGKIIRPIMCFTKDEILSFLSQNNIHFRKDSSNNSEKYLRNRIRLRLIPFIKKHFNPNILETLNNTAHNLLLDYGFILGHIKNIFKNALSEIKKGEKIELVISQFKNEPVNIRTEIYKKALKRANLYCGDITKKNLESIDKLLLSSKANILINLPKGVIARKNYDKLSFERSDLSRVNFQNMPDEIHELIINEPGTYPITHGRYIKIEKDTGFKRDNISSIYPRKLWISEEKISFPLFLRSRKTGDRFIPLGMQNEVKLKDYFIKRKIPMKIRNSLCLLTHNNEIIAILGIEISEKYKVCKIHESSLCISLI